ncbi:hypothetical protein [uncultured Gammaproteobacteria bacterium]|nr:hypothetical protein [uncultured Gammaproteobacteria bacterium]
MNHPKTTLFMCLYYKECKNIKIIITIKRPIKLVKTGSP